MLTEPPSVDNYSRNIQNLKARRKAEHFSLHLEVSFCFMLVLGPFPDRKPRGG